MTVATVNIAGLPVATSASSSDVTVIVQNGVTKQASIALIGSSTSAAAALSFTAPLQRSGNTVLLGGWDGTADNGVMYRASSAEVGVTAAGTIGQLLLGQGAASAPGWLDAGTTGQILLGNTSSAPSWLAAGTTGQLLQSNTGASPSWLPAGVSGQVLMGVTDGPPAWTPATSAATALSLPYFTESLTTLKALPSPPPPFVEMGGYTTLADAGSGSFVWVAGVTAAANDGNIVALDVGGSGRFERPLNLPVYSLQSFGAKCDGSTDDTARVNVALASGLRLTGLGAVCAVSGNVTLPDNTWLQDVTVKQLDANSASRRTLVVSGAAESITLIRVIVDRNGAPTDVSNVSNAAGIYISGQASPRTLNIYMEDVEVFGGGPGRGVQITDANLVRLVRPYIHDIYWWNATDPGSGGEKIVGMAAARVNTWLVDDPVITRLMGWYASTKLRAYQTDGINASACETVTVNGGSISYVSEGFDGSGSEVTTNCWFNGTSFTDIGAAAFKQLSTRYSGAQGCRFIRAGLWGVATGTSSGISAAAAAQYQRYNNCITIDVGANHDWPAGSVRAYEVSDAGGGAPRPTDIEFNNCPAIGNVGSITGSIANWWMTVSATASGSVATGQNVAGAGVTAGTYLVGPGKLASIIGSITGTALTVSSTHYGEIVAGQMLTGPNIDEGTTIVSGAGANWVLSTSNTAPANTAILLSLAATDIWTVNQSQTVASTTLTLTSNMSVGYSVDATLVDYVTVNDAYVTGENTAKFNNITSRLTYWRSDNKQEILGGAIAPISLTSETRAASFDSDGFISRYDDNGLHIGLTLTNLGITGINQGQSIGVRYGTGGTFSAAAGFIDMLTTDTWVTAANRSTKWRFRTLSSNIVTTSFEILPAGTVVQSGAAIPAGGTAGFGYMFTNTSNFGVFPGSGAPTLAAAQGSLYTRSDGADPNTRAYVNTDGSTAWQGLFSGVPSFINTDIYTINFSTVGDTAVSVRLPAEYSRYANLRGVLSGASNSLVSAAFGLFTGAGGTGTAVIASGTAATITTGAEGTGGNMQIPSIVSATTLSLNNSTLFFRVQAIAAVSATAKFVLAYEPIS